MPREALRLRLDPAVRCAAFHSARGTFPARNRRMRNAVLQDCVRRLGAEDPIGVGTAAGWRVVRHDAAVGSTRHILRAVGPNADAVLERTGSRTIAIEIGGGAGAAAERAAGLASVWNALGPTRTVPRPWAHWPEWEATVESCADGETLSGIARHAILRTAGGEDVARAAAWCTTAGAWLRDFQVRSPERYAVRDAHGDPATALGELDADLRRLGTLLPGIDAALRNRLLAHAVGLLHAVPSGALGERTWSHGRFGADAVTVRPDALAVSGFAFPAAHPLEDAADFVESLTRSTSIWVDPARCARLERAFLAGYGGAAVHPGLFLFLRLRRVLRTTLGQAERARAVRLRVWPHLALGRARLRRFADLLSHQARARAA